MSEFVTSETGRRPKPIGRYRRAVRITVNGGTATAEMEDDVHHFAVAVTQAEGVVTAIRGTTWRAPWSTCGGGDRQLETMVGLRLDEVRGLPLATRMLQCLHLFDLAAIAAAHADQPGFRRLYQVDADYDGVLPRLTLWRDGQEVLAWEVDAGVVRGSRFDGAPVATLGRRLEGLDADEVEAVMILRRATSISHVRNLDLDGFTDSEVLHAGKGPTCFAYQPERQGPVVRNRGSSRDFWAQRSWPLKTTQPG